MKFEELASEAGRAAFEVGRHAARPAIAVILQRSRRRTILTASSAVAVIALGVIVGGVLFSSTPGSESPTGAATGTTTTEPQTTTSVPVSTTTLAEEPAPPSTLTGREDCPVTTPGDTPFTPATEIPELVPPTDLDAVWYGTPELWTWVHEDGMVWKGLPLSADGTLTQKTFWWSVDLDITEEPEPEIDVTAELVGESTRFEEGRVTNGWNPDVGTFAIVGLDFPHPGCWSITAQYRGASVSYVAWVEGR
ncbi:MAG: hypothetical protein PVG83_10415 [Acidimicrobiia bacterium]|jgi:hypothetical protein